MIHVMWHVAMIESKGVKQEYNPLAEHRIDKATDERSYLYACIEQMAYCNHPVETQTNERLNKAIATVAPKNVCNSNNISLFSRVALVILDCVVSSLNCSVYFRLLFCPLGHHAPFHLASTYIIGSSLGSSSCSSVGTQNSFDIITKGWYSKPFSSLSKSFFCASILSTFLKRHIKLCHFVLPPTSQLCLIVGNNTFFTHFAVEQ
jgi:hypothetical protein